MDSKDTAGADRPTATVTQYRERLTVPLIWWPMGAVVVGLLCYEVALAGRGAFWQYPVFAALAAAAVVLLWSMGRASVAVRDGEIWAGSAHLPIELIDKAAAIGAEAKSAAMGRQLDPAAFVYQKGWVKTMVVLVLDDADDPTPYWLISTRHPERILAAIPTSTTLDS